MPQAVFVTGTDTGVGKTLVALGLMDALRSRGYRVAGMKPVATGCARKGGQLLNDDALRLQRRASVRLPYEWVNPYAFEPPIAPHIAAAEAGVSIDPELIRARLERLGSRADWVVMEGVGGWKVPLGPGRMLADLVADLGLPVILVVGVRLGCLNHALLSTESILRSGSALAGWVANQMDRQCERIEANIEALRERLPAPLLGILPHRGRPRVQEVAALLDLDSVLAVYGKGGMVGSVPSTSASG
jgi:dethiobiotin synthetase